MPDHDHANPTDRAQPARMPVDDAFRRQLRGYRLATAEILYHLPDHPALLQTFIWQQYDLAPGFPKLRAFLDFWDRNIEGALHSVRLAHSGLVGPAELRSVDGVFRLH